MIASSFGALAFVIVAMTGGGGDSTPSPVCPAGETAVPVYHTVNGKKKFWHYNCVTPATTAAKKSTTKM
jgi:hypothetical protein